MAEPTTYALLSAGSGTRMGALTSDRAKVLVDVAGRTILEHNLRGIALADPDARVLVIAGHGAASVAGFVAGTRDWIDAETLVNPDYRTAGPLRSIAVALAALSPDTTTFAIGNGDTIFEQAALTALLLDRSDAALLISQDADGEEDDVQVLIEGRRVARAAKRLAPAGTLPVSAGLFQVRGRDAIDQLTTTVHALIGEEDRSGTSLTWHAMIAALDTAGLPVTPIVVPGDSWSEFDSPDCIARYERRQVRQA